MAERMNDRKTGPEIEGPEVVLKFKRWFFLFTLAAVLIICWFSIFGVVMPYLATGDFNQIWPANKGSELKKASIFIASSICILGFPTLAPVFYYGDLYIFSNRVELRPYLPMFSKRIVYFDTLNITDRNVRGRLLTNSVLPKWWKSPYKYWREASWLGITVPFFDITLSNPKSLPQAWTIINAKNKAL